MIHRTSCNKDIKDKKGNVIICCGDEIDEISNEFAQCNECYKIDLQNQKELTGAEE